MFVLLYPGRSEAGAAVDMNLCEGKQTEHCSVGTPLDFHNCCCTLLCDITAVRMICLPCYTRALFIPCGIILDVAACRCEYRTYSPVSYQVLLYCCWNIPA